MYNGLTGNARIKKPHGKQTAEEFCERLNSTRQGKDIEASPSADLPKVSGYFFSSLGVRTISSGDISLSPNALTASLSSSKWAS